jgi:hypothetical protein
VGAGGGRNGDPRPCGGVGSSGAGQRRSDGSTSSTTGTGHVTTTALRAPTTTTVPVPSHLPVPQPLAPSGGVSAMGPGVGTPTGRQVGGLPAVYESTLVPPGGVQPAGIAWMAPDCSRCSSTGARSARVVARTASPPRPAHPGSIPRRHLQRRVQDGRGRRRLLHRGPAHRPACRRSGVARPWATVD